ncbi:MAG: Transposase [Bryobacterales bacterium]|nr:Transposase [Bryobacterales bacterium]
MKNLGAHTNLPPYPLAAAKSVNIYKVMSPAKALCLHEEAYRILGVDLTTNPGISVMHIQAVIAEVGPDLSKFRSPAAFASWLGLCPDNDVSGGKVLWKFLRSSALLPLRPSKPIPKSRRWKTGHFTCYLNRTS